MIVFDLRCTAGHVFEAWFGSSEAYAAQRDARQIACPICGDVRIDKALMAPNIPAKSNRTVPSVPPVAAPASPPDAVKAALRELAQAQARALEGSRWVGAGFAGEARAMHAGDTPQAPIHGQASLAEARALIDDGVPVAPLPFPVVPPKVVN